MKKKCKVLSLLLSFVVILSVGSVKAEPKTVTVELTIDNNIPTVNGDPVVPLESEIFIEKGRTFVPVRFPSEVFDIKTIYESETKTITFANKKDIEIEMKIDDTSVKVNGKEMQIDSPPIIRRNRTQVPIRFIMETFGAIVTWDPDLHKVTIVHEIPEE